MPIVTEAKEKEIQYILWKAIEPFTFFSGQIQINEYEQQRLRDIKHPHRALQFICARYLLRLLLPHVPQTAFIAEDDVPVLTDRPEYISISHSDDWVAVMVSQKSPCGIDVQGLDKRILRIKDKFSTEEERALLSNNYNEEETSTLIWTAKEAVYKCAHIKGLGFILDMRVKKFSDSHLEITFTRTKVDIPVHFKWGIAYCLSYCTNH